MKEKIYIYALLEDDTIRYVGKSINPIKRFKEHISESLNKKKTHKHRWIVKMIRQKKQIKLKILEITDKEHWQEKEKKWISLFKDKLLTNCSSGGLGGRPRKNWLNFEDAKKFVHALNLESIKEWKWYCKNGGKPENIPMDAHRAYKNYGWISYGDWLGTKKIATQNMVFLPFEDAKKFIHSLNFQSIKDWKKFCKSKEKPTNIPIEVHKVYKNQGWISYTDWLGTNKLISKKALSFLEARKFVHSLNLKSYDDWLKYCKNRKNNIPSNPDKFYKNNGWISWNDWIGKAFLSFKDSRKFVHKLKIKSNREWRNATKHNKIPPNIPTSPSTFYKKDWVSWYDWLGK